MSYHSLTCDPDCCYGDCACACFCHPTEADMLMPGTSNVSNQSPLDLDTEGTGKKKAPGANRGQPTTTNAEESK